MNYALELAQDDPDRVVKKIVTKRASKSFLSFVSYTKPDYEINWHHKLICDTLQRFIEDPTKDRLMIFCPPRTGKSELVSRRLPAFLFGIQPNISIIGASYGADLAQAMNRDLQRVIDSDLYRDIFPDTNLSSKNIAKSSKGNYIRTSDKFEIVGHQGQYKSAGVGGALTGSGCDLLIIDDPVKDMKEAMSSTTQRVTWDWFASVASTRLSKNGKAIVMLTRWNEMDLAGKLLERAKQDEDADQWEVLCFPMEYEKNHPYVHPLDKRKEGDLLWPEWFPSKRVKKIKATGGSKVYNSLYQQRPSPDGGSIFKRNWFNFYKELPDLDYYMISVDCTFKNTENSDFVAMGVWGVKGANKYLMWLIKKRLDFPETLAELAALNRRFPNARYNLVEDKANGSAVLSVFKNKIKGMLAFNPGRDSKEARAASIAPQVEAGNLYLPDPYYPKNRDMPWVKSNLDNYIEEMVSFPNAANDDVVDMTTQALIKMGSSSGWLTELTKLGEKQNITKDFTSNVADLMGWDIGNDLDDLEYQV